MFEAIFLNQIVSDNLSDPSSDGVGVGVVAVELCTMISSVMITGGRVAGRVIVLVMFDMFPL